MISIAGYQLDFLESKLQLKEDHNAYLINENGNQSKSNWSGLRFLFGLGVRF